MFHVYSVFYSLCLVFFFFFFFFQAEDGIRDHCVTGVQTCALPIWRFNQALFTDCYCVIGVLPNYVMILSFDFLYLLEDRKSVV